MYFWLQKHICRLSKGWFPRLDYNPSYIPMLNPLFQCVFNFLCSRWQWRHQAKWTNRGQFKFLSWNYFRICISYRVINISFEYSRYFDSDVCKKFLTHSENNPFQRNIFLVSMFYVNSTPVRNNQSWISFLLNVEP